MAAWRYEFYFLEAKTIFYSLAPLVRKILFCHSKIKFISSRHRVISSMSLHKLCVLHVNKKQPFHRRQPIKERPYETTTTGTLKSNKFIKKTNNSAGTWRFFWSFYEVESMHNDGVKHGDFFRSFHVIRVCKYLIWLVIAPPHNNAKTMEILKLPYRACVLLVNIRCTE